jgi:NADPH-dependent curcumin reductase CurA
MNIRGRMALCGMIAEYGSDGDAPGPNLLPALTGRLRIEGFNAFDSFNRLADYQRLATGWIKDGLLHSSDTIVEGLENTPAAFVALLNGEKAGKLIVRAGLDPRA